MPERTPRSGAEGGFPEGWFGLCFSDELPPGRALARRIQGRDVVVFRTTSGAARALDAHCPHLGAHLGHGGEVRGETIRCPFHGFCFDGADGRCTETGYGTRPPPLARSRAWSVDEVGGIVFAYHGEGEPPWRLPSLERWGVAPSTSSWEFDGRPQEIAENSVDIGHLSVVHGYVEPRVTHASFEGHLIKVQLQFRRPLPLFGRVGPLIDVDVTIEQHGLGFAVVCSLAAGVHNRFIIASTSLDERRVVLRTSVGVKGPWAPLGGRVVRALDSLSLWPLVVSFRGDVGQDIPIWSHKKFIERPAIAEGDGPLGKYRSWAKQFYR